MNGGQTVGEVDRILYETFQALTLAQLAHLHSRSCFQIARSLACITRMLGRHMRRRCTWRKACRLRSWRSRGLSGGQHCGAISGRAACCIKRDEPLQALACVGVASCAANTGGAVGVAAM
jgi:hypothetical protein